MFAALQAHLRDASSMQPLSVPVPADDAAFRARKSVWERSVRTARRELQLSASGQRARLCEHIAPDWKRLLWIHESMPQIGDALMDLAPRSLLREHGLKIDLCAASSIANLFQGDAWFGRVVGDDRVINASDYDAVIVLSHDRKALRTKRLRLPELPWVSLQAYYGGPDFHRARFATQRLADLLGERLNPVDFDRHAAQKLCITSAAAADAAACLPSGMATLALCVGGVHPERTYHRFADLLAVLAAARWPRILLVGSGNGRALADRLSACAHQLPCPMQIVDQVGRTTLQQAHALLSRADAIVCADGGLMHLAFATGVPTVALFHEGISPKWRLPFGSRSVGLQSSAGPVDGIEPARISAALARLDAATAIDRHKT